METLKMNIHQRMHKAMMDMEGIVKRKKGNGMLFDFVAHDDVTSTVKKYLGPYGILPVHTVMDYTVDYSHAAIPIDSKGNPRICHFMKVKMTFHNIDTPSDCIEVSGFGYAIDTLDKGYGKALSYCVKNICLKTFFLPTGTEEEIDAYQGQDDKEEENNNTAKQEPKPAQKPKITSSQVEFIRAQIKDMPELREEILKYVGKNMVADIELHRFQDVMKFIDMRLKKEGVA